jgi:hypothetical protein
MLSRTDDFDTQGGTRTGGMRQHQQAQQHYF